MIFYVFFFMTMQSFCQKLAKFTTNKYWNINFPSGWYFEMCNFFYKYTVFAEKRLNMRLIVKILTFSGQIFLCTTFLRYMLLFAKEQSNSQFKRYLKERGRMVFPEKCGNFQRKKSFAMNSEFSTYFWEYNRFSDDSFCKPMSEVHDLGLPISSACYWSLFWQPTTSQFWK